VWDQEAKQIKEINSVAMGGGGCIQDDLNGQPLLWHSKVHVSKALRIPGNNAKVFI
jgi:hypothetical protein